MSGEALPAGRAGVDVREFPREQRYPPWRRSPILPKMLAIRIVVFLVGGVFTAFGLTVPLDFEVLEELRVATGWRIVFLVLGVMLVVATLVPRVWRTTPESATSDYL